MKNYIIVFFSFAWAVASPSNSSVPPRPYSADTSGTHFSIRWEGPSGSANAAAGLLVMEHTESSIVERLLVVTPNQRRVVLTYWLNPSRGEEHWDVLDEESGWSMTYEIGYDVLESTIASFLAASNSRQESGSPLPLNLSVSIPPMRAFSWTADAGPEAMAVPFAKALVEERPGFSMVQALPPGLIEAILFLESSLERPIATADSAPFPGVAAIFREPFVFLEQILRKEGSEEPAGLEPWRQDVELEKGVLQGPDLEFVSQFQTVENADPMSDLRLRGE